MKSLIYADFFYAEIAENLPAGRQGHGGPQSVRRTNTTAGVRWTTDKVTVY